MTEWICALKIKMLVKGLEDKERVPRGPEILRKSLNDRQKTSSPKKRKSQPQIRTTKIPRKHSSASRAAPSSEATDAMSKRNRRHRD